MSDVYSKGLPTISFRYSTTTWPKRLLLVALILIVVSVIYVAIADRGTLSVHYADSKAPAHQQIKTSLEQWRGFDANALQGVNRPSRGFSP